MYPFIGKIIFIDYEDSKFTLTFVDKSILKIEGKMKDNQIKEIVEYTTILVDKNIYLLYWYEQLSQSMVSQIQNLNNMRVYSNVVNLNTYEFVHMKGKLFQMKDKNGDQQNENKDTKTIIPK